MADTKVQYIIKFGIAHCLKKLIYDVRNTPFSFLFDGTTSSQVKKQYDAYLQYWTKRNDTVISAYCGSLFVGHCPSDDLVEHYNSFQKDINFNSSYLLHIGMDGPNVNLAFERKLANELGTPFLKLGSCSLRPIHTTCRKRIKKLSFDIDLFFNDIHFFF